MAQDTIDQSTKRRATALNEKGVFPEKTALVVALYENGHTTTDIARLTDTDPSTVSHQLARAKRLAGEAAWTTEHAPDLDQR